MTGSRLILIVEDDDKTAAALTLYLEHDGYRVIRAADGRQALELSARERPDLVLLDLLLPQISGMEVCRQLRRETTVPVIMLTAKSSESDKLEGLEHGADDYVTKPFSPRELVARVRAVLRRTSPSGGEGERLVHDDLTLEPATRRVTAGGEEVTLTPTEFRLLEVMVRAPDRVFTREVLVEQAFGGDFDGFDRTVDVHVKNLRKKLDRSRPHIETVFGVGYRLSGPRLGGQRS
ncbi:MAG TPA: response regulator transcription factor [Thermoanaerobaculia bacterium]|nr:response regulator transcription factor [Thermoanaerobaculia bacterium]